MKKTIAALVAVAGLLCVAAKAQTISCPFSRDLSDRVVKNWEHDSLHDRYQSYITKSNDGQLFTGILYGQEGHRPSDANPHLIYFHSTLQAVPEYGIWNMDCIYEIRNPEIKGGDDGYFHVVTSMGLERKCKLELNGRDVTCD
jgi:hypothetical protein